MADLNPLIRFRKHIVDEKQRFLSQLYRDAEKIEQSKQVVIDQMENEKKLAEEMGSTYAQTYLGRYLEGGRKKIRALEASLKKMETRIAAAQEDMRAAFSDMKKIQITQRKREEREEKEAQKKEDKELDEIGMDQFRRKKERE